MSCESNTSISCPCTYACQRHGKCCACVAFHTKDGKFPACFFSEAMEKTYDRSLSALLKDRKIESYEDAQRKTP
ncbi:MAG: DUF6485 family protein [Peptococcaceae bacterium]|nr:DUF6485 family protein [Peptococcaceae bacterium]